MRRLKDLGLNCVEWFSVVKPIDYDIFKLYDRFSIRTAPLGTPSQVKYRLHSVGIPNIDQGNPPHIYDITAEQAHLACQILNDAGYACLVCEGVNPKDALLAGAAVKFDSYPIVLEVADGPYMVRRVTQEGLIDRRFEYVDHFELCEEKDEEIFEVASDVAAFCPINSVVEFSWYKTKPGWKKQGAIFWDVYPLSSGSKEWWSK
jgi:hypothetical protein